MRSAKPNFVTKLVQVLHIYNLAAMEVLAAIELIVSLICIQDGEFEFLVLVDIAS